ARGPAEREARRGGVPRELGDAALARGPLDLAARDLALDRGEPVAAVARALELEPLPLGREDAELVAHPAAACLAVGDALVERADEPVEVRDAARRGEGAQGVTARDERRGPLPQRVVRVAVREQRREALDLRGRAHDGV